MYNTQQQRLHFTVHQIFKLNYTNSKNCALLKLERMHVFNTEYKAGGSTNTKLGEEYHSGQPLLWRPEALCIPRSVWSPSTFSSTGMLSLWNPLGSPALWCKYSLPSTPEVSPLDPWLLPRPSVLTTFWWVRISYPLLADYKSLDIFDPGHQFLSHPRVEEQSTGQTKPPLASPPYNTGQIHPFERRFLIFFSKNNLF